VCSSDLTSPEVRRSTGLYAGHGMLLAAWRLRSAQEGISYPAQAAARREDNGRAGIPAAGGQGLGPARTRRRRFLLRAQMVIRGSEEREAHLPDLQRGRIRAGHVQGQANHL